MRAPLFALKTSTFKWIEVMALEICFEKIRELDKVLAVAEELSA